MTTLLISLSAAGGLGFIAWFVLEGVRIGDRPGDTTVSAVEFEASGVAICFIVCNPGHQPVLAGASVRRRSLRMWRSNGSYVTVPRRSVRDELLAPEHALVCIVQPAECLTMRLVPAQVLPRRTELVVAIGEPDRLRVIHRAVTLPRTRLAGLPPPGAEQREP